MFKLRLVSRTVRTVFYDCLMLARTSITLSNAFKAIWEDSKYMIDLRPICGKYMIDRKYRFLDWSYLKTEYPAM